MYLCLVFHLSEVSISLKNDFISYSIYLLLTISTTGKSNVLEWQLRNMQINIGKITPRTFGIQYHNIVNNPDASNHELKMSFHGLVVFTCEASEYFLDSFAELCAKNIKLIIEKKKLPFILCLKRIKPKMAVPSTKNSDIVLPKKVMDTLQSVLAATHLVIKTEPLLSKLCGIISICD